MSAIESVQTFGRKKTATAVAFVKRGNGMIKVNGIPISLLQPEILKLKTFEPVLLIGTEKFAQVSQRSGCGVGDVGETTAAVAVAARRFYADRPLGGVAGRPIRKKAVQ